MKAWTCPAPAKGLMVAVMLALGGPANGAAPELPPPPKGYSNATEVMTAIGAGQLKLITQPKELPPGVVEVTNVEYGRIGDRALTLDLYLPEKRTKPTPGLIFIHGGAWSGGSRDMYRYYTVRYAQRGYVCATISYRLSREAPFPAAVQDAKCAVRWLRANAARYGVDPDKLGVIGGSAGGHLAMMVGYAAGVASLEGQGGHAAASSRVHVVVNFYGPTDLTTPFARRAGPVKGFLGGKTYDEAPALYAEASPITYITSKAPPTLIVHGSIDDVVPIDQAERLVARLKELGVPYTYERLEGWPHALDAAEIVNERCQLLMNRFFDAHLPLPR
jgi:acetyl esterase/lipase